MNNSILAAMAAILIFATLTSSTFAHVSDQKRYNDGYNAGQDYAACDYSNCDNGNHGYDKGCPNDKKHTYEFCNGYSLGYTTKWNSLADETTTQQQTQSQAQGDSNVRIDGSRNNVVIAPRQTQEQAASSGDDSDSEGGEYGK
jgi:hypothetical protein